MSFLVNDGDSADEVSLLDILDHVLNSGIVIHGRLIISLAQVDLVYVGLNVLLTSVETALRQRTEPLPLPRKRK
ncbi:MAG TPA: gas vesicle protein [Terriglobales bacterium]|nr:gas vesicle protein [Terriglobales bacterium]